MDWREQLQPCSFRGVPCETKETYERSSGRRVALHEYPLRDLPFAEDMGRKARRWTLTLVVLGDDYMAQRDKLRAALEAAGPGELIHPRTGRVTVSVEDVRETESTAARGQCTFVVQFVEPGENALPTTRLDTAAQVRSTATTALTASKAGFINEFMTKGFPAWVKTGPAALLDRGLGYLRSGTGMMTNITAPIAELRSTIDSMGGQLIGLMQSPQALANQFTGLIDGVFSNAANLSGVMGMLGNFSFSPATLNGKTRNRRQEQINTHACGRLMHRAAVIGAVNAVVQMSPVPEVSGSVSAPRQAITSPFDSYEHAMQVRAELLTAIDAIATDADDALLVAFDDLRALLVQHLEAHGVQLPRIRQVTTLRALPALVLAHELYGDITLADDIVRRNRVRHPAFVDAGQLEVLNG